MDAVDGLDEIVELETNAEEDRPRAMTLEVAARAEHLRLTG